MHLGIRIPESGVVEDLDDVVEDLLYGDRGVFPSVHDARDDVLHDCDGDFPCGLVEDVGKVVFGEHGVRGVGAVGVYPGFELGFLRRVDDGRGAILELVGGLRNEREDVGREDGEDKDCELFGDFLDEGTEAGDVADDVGDGANDLVTELEDGVDILCELLRVEASRRLGRCTGAIGRGINMLALASLRLFLKRISFGTESSRTRKLIKQLPEHRTLSPILIGRMRLRKRIRYLINLRLRKLILRLSQNRMQEIHPAKGASNQRPNPLSAHVNLG